MPATHPRRANEAPRDPLASAMAARARSAGLTSVKATLGQADAASYAAKRDSRNRASETPHA
ncbi:hypothetical protein M0D69_02165 [Caballeronia sp. SEWSISQ10-4 2]|uniref:hypothetical protein n=1 Tax=Caballeronia sp. SEWSISQ10-4 2 TaxID=2937438 RepID=UPI00264F8056|nr:hypothetical protein [Caballeronia sp. SEWSISQ10-4 2]MDN7176846.1 hypothetical protein [Caballeronia sp. SEWSISQ10-4 2]